MMRSAVQILLCLAIAFANLSRPVLAANGGKKKMHSLTDIQLAQKVNALPMVELSSDWEEDFLKHATEIADVLKKSKMNPQSSFQRVVAFNHRSPITNEGKYYTFVISLPKKIVLRLEGDDLWLIEHQKKNFNDEQKKKLLELLK